MISSCQIDLLPGSSSYDNLTTTTSHANEAITAIETANQTSNVSETATPVSATTAPTETTTQIIQNSTIKVNSSSVAENETKGVCVSVL